MRDNFKFTVPGKPEYVRAVRMAIASLACNLGFDVEAIDDIKVAVSEACTNIVAHGCREGEDVEYEVTCELFDDRLSICVEDECGGYHIGSYKKPELPAEESGGLGLFIIESLMDEVNIESQVGVGTHIKMVKYIQ